MNYQEFLDGVNKFIVDYDMLVNTSNLDNKNFTDITGGDRTWRTFYDNGLTPKQAVLIESNISGDGIEQILSRKK